MRHHRTSDTATAIILGAAFTVAPPQPASEANYTIPGGATVVTNATELATAMSGVTAVDIKLLNGSYTRAAALSTNTPHRLYGESVAGVVLNFGLDFRQSGAYKCKGMTFTIPDAAHATMAGGESAAVDSFDGAGMEVTDLVIDGSLLITAGVYIQGVSGATVRRIQVSNVNDYGVILNENNAASTHQITALSDVNGNHIYRTATWRGQSNGGGECAVFIGNQVSGECARFKARDCGAMGLQATNACKNVLMTDIDADNCWGHDGAGPTTNLASTGIYFEHFVKNCTVRRFWCGHETGDLVNGISNEWDDGFNRALSGSITLPNATIPTLSDVYALNDAGIGWPTSGTIYVGETQQIAVAYTGLTALNFTGCTGGSGSFTNGALISSTPGGFQASTDNIYDQGFIRCDSVRTPTTIGHGINFGKGTRRPTVTNVTFVGMAGGAAILDETNTPQCTGLSDSMLSQSGNNFSGLGSGAAQILYG